MPTGAARRDHPALRSGRAFTFLVDTGIRPYQTLGSPVALTVLAFVIGLALLPFGEDTRRKALPA
jgi:hypothetical protein